MQNIPFELTNEQRSFLGLTPVNANWELVVFDHYFFYFDNCNIVKQITVSSSSYQEYDIDEKTSQDRTLVLPKTSKGKPKKFNYTAIQKFKATGVYFSFSSTFLIIANLTTQTTFYSESYKDKDLEFLKTWLANWIKESTPKDIEDINAFKNAKRQHCKYKEGDFFALKIDRKNYAFGRLLIDVSKAVKQDNLKQGKNYGLTNLMGKALIVKIYHYISDSLDVDLEKLAKLEALPSQAVMDNHLYYGENVIIGNIPLDNSDYDMLISYGQSINSKDKNKVYLQYGFIFKELDIKDFNLFLREESKRTPDLIYENPYRNEGIGFSIYLDHLHRCIQEKSNMPFWQDTNNYHSLYDLRNPCNIETKRQVFKAFGLDADKSYIQNLELA